eukprot:TRINITY_DN93897_c0_g1_i1.p1 TRINITY_DN93897_c0_g1~~TRINITY_DN93897_c0_g1_i1.p1  ORF type:complete len:391 (+),score=25.91 TRINITY_DN93897_c0_g1_i1:95-1267(+)
MRSCLSGPARVGAGCVAVWVAALCGTCVLLVLCWMELLPAGIRPSNFVVYHSTLEEEAVAYGATGSDDQEMNNTTDTIDRTNTTTTTTVSTTTATTTTTTSTTTTTFTANCFAEQVAASQRGLPSCNSIETATTGRYINGCWEPYDCFLQAPSDVVQMQQVSGKKLLVFGDSTINPVSIELQRLLGCKPCCVNTLPVAEKGCGGCQSMVNSCRNKVTYWNLAVSRFDDKTTKPKSDLDVLDYLFRVWLPKNPVDVIIGNIGQHYPGCQKDASLYQAHATTFLQSVDVWKTQNPRGVFLWIETNAVCEEMDVWAYKLTSQVGVNAQNQIMRKLLADRTYKVPIAHAFNLSFFPNPSVRNSACFLHRDRVHLTVHYSWSLARTLLAVLPQYM